MKYFFFVQMFEKSVDCLNKLLGMKVFLFTLNDNNRVVNSCVGGGVDDGSGSQAGLRALINPSEI